MSSNELPLFLVEREIGELLSAVSLPVQLKQKLSLIIGPEGGWTKTELNQAEQGGYRKVSLGQRILRAETASLAGLAILQSRMGRI